MQEAMTRSTVAFLLDHIPKQKPGLRVVHINLFDSSACRVLSLPFRLSPVSCVRSRRKNSEDTTTISVGNQQR